MAAHGEARIVDAIAWLQKSDAAWTSDAAYDGVVLGAGLKLYEMRGSTMESA